MKTIEPVIIWFNGEQKTAKLLNAYASRVTLNNSASFSYTLFTEESNGRYGDPVAQGDLFMNQDEYVLWENDSVAWDFIASKLNLVITGDYVPPVIE